MRLRHGLAAAAAALALLPGSALAQGAGDDQYTDPFAGEEEPAATPAPAAPAPSAPAPAAPAPAAPAPAAPAPAAAPAQPAPAAAPATLPYTGIDGWPLAAAGAALLGAGITLRIRLRDAD